MVLLTLPAGFIPLRMAAYCIKACLAIFIFFCPFAPCPVPAGTLAIGRILFMERMMPEAPLTVAMALTALLFARADGGRCFIVHKIPSPHRNKNGAPSGVPNDIKR